MSQKILKVGSSAAVTIPKKSLEELGLKIGDRVEVVDSKNGITFSVRKKKELSKDDENIARLTMNFINRYRKDLEALARK